jgi:hypothetical protein
MEDGDEVHRQGRTERHSEHHRPDQAEVLDMACHLLRHILEKGEGNAMLYDEDTCLEVEVEEGH